MPSRTECPAVEFAGDNAYITDRPLKRYIVVYQEYSDIIEASNMTTNDHGVVFEEAIIRSNGGTRIGIGRTFIEHGVLVGVTLIEREFGNVRIDNDTQLGLFSVINDD